MKGLADEIVIEQVTEEKFKSLGWEKAKKLIDEFKEQMSIENLDQDVDDEHK